LGCKTKVRQLTPGGASKGGNAVGREHESTTGERHAAPQDGTPFRHSARKQSPTSAEPTGLLFVRPINQRQVFMRKVRFAMVGLVVLCTGLMACVTAQSAADGPEVEETGESAAELGSCDGDPNAGIDQTSGHDL
jgi:hypothetical protein